MFQAKADQRSSPLGALVQDKAAETGWMNRWMELILYSSVISFSIITTIANTKVELGNVYNIFISTFYGCGVIFSNTPELGTAFL